MSTDGRNSISGFFVSLRAHVKEVATLVTWSYCCIHRQSLACVYLTEGLNAVLADSVNIVNYIDSQALKSRLFTSLYEDMDSLHSNLLYRNEVRGVSCGKVLKRLVELRYEVP